MCLLGAAGYSHAWHQAAEGLFHAVSERVPRGIWTLRWRSQKRCSKSIGAHACSEKYLKSETEMFAYKSPSRNLCRLVLKLGIPRCTALYQSPQFSHCFSWVSHMRVMRRQVGTCTLCKCLLKPVFQRHSTFHEGRAFLDTNPYNIFYGETRKQIPIM